MPAWISIAGLSTLTNPVYSDEFPNLEWAFAVLGKRARPPRVLGRGAGWLGSVDLVVGRGGVVDGADEERSHLRPGNRLAGDNS